MAPVVHGLWTPEDFHSAPSFKKNVVQADLKRMPLKKKKKRTGMTLNTNCVFRVRTTIFRKRLCTLYFHICIPL